MQRDRLVRHARHQDLRRTSAERKLDLGPHQHERLPGRFGTARLQRFRQKHHGRDADATAHEQRAGTFGMRDEAVTDRTQHADGRANRLLRQRREPGAYDLVEDLDPACPRIDTHDRQWPAHRPLRVAREVREAAGHRGGGALRRLDANDELSARVRLLREQPAVLDEDRVAMHASFRRRAATASLSVDGAGASCGSNLTPAGLHVADLHVAHDRREHRHAHGDAVADLLLHGR